MPSDVPLLSAEGDDLSSNNAKSLRNVLEEPGIEAFFARWYVEKSGYDFLRRWTGQKSRLAQPQKAGWWFAWYGFTRRRSVYGGQWGMSKQQVLGYVAECRNSGKWNLKKDTMRTFVDKFVVPDTKGSGTGLALKTNYSSPLKVDTMVVHHWDQNANEFFKAFEKEVDEAESVWISAFALYQARDDCGPDIDAQNGRYIHHGPLRDAIQRLRSKRGFDWWYFFWKYVTPNKRKGRVIAIQPGSESSDKSCLCDRLWCAWELFVAKTNNLEVVIAGDTSKTWLPDDLSNAKCSVQLDTFLLTEAVESGSSPTYAINYQFWGIVWSIILFIVMVKVCFIVIPAMLAAPMYFTLVATTMALWVFFLPCLAPMAHAVGVLVATTVMATIAGTLATIVGTILTGVATIGAGCGGTVISIFGGFKLYQKISDRRDGFTRLSNTLETIKAKADK